MKNVCVFGSSSCDLADEYYKAARQMGARIAQAGFGLVFGAGGGGLMGAAARGAAESGGRVIGVIPKMMNAPGVAFQRCSELIVTDTMHERKAQMAKRADAFVALPGGFGTLEEVLEVIAFKQLALHSKPVVLLGTNGFYSCLAAQFDEIIGQRFAGAGAKTLYAVMEDPDAVMDYIARYDPGSTYHKRSF